jgi:hypothetical protein
MVIARYGSRAGFGRGKSYAVLRRGHTPLTEKDRELLRLMKELYEQLSREIGDEFFGVTSRMLDSEMERVGWLETRGMPRERVGKAGKKGKREGERVRKREHVTEWLRLMEGRGLVAIEGRECREIGWGLTSRGNGVC